MPEVSIIVCSHNGINRLKPCFLSLKQLDLSPDIEIELILIDSASSDRTAEKMNTYDFPFSKKVCRISEPGQSKALNRGIAEATGELLAFTDDDCRVDSKWINAYVTATIKFPEAGYFFGPIFPKLPPSLPQWWNLAPRSLRGRDQGTEPKVYKSFCRDSYPIGANMAVRRSCLHDGIHFDEKLGPAPSSQTWLGADTKLGRNLQNAGIWGCYVPQAFVHHDINFSRVNLNYLVAHSFTSGRCSLYYKSTDHNIGRLILVLRNLYKCSSSSYHLIYSLIMRQKLKALRAFLDMAKDCGVWWEYIVTIGGLRNQ